MTHQKMIETKRRSSSEPSLHILDVIQIILKNWVWFAFSILTFITLGYIQTERTALTYKANAVILILEESKSTSNVSKAALFSDLSTDQTSASVDYEITKIGSSSLLTTVVNKLNLNTTYNIKQSLRNLDIYGSSPISIDWIDMGNSSYVTIEIQPISIEEQKLLVNGVKVGIGDTIRIENTKFIINATSFWRDRFENELIRVQYTNENIYAQNMKGKLSISRTDGNTPTVKLSYADNNAQRTKDILNTLIDIYAGSIIKKQQAITDNLDTIITQRISMIRDELIHIDRLLTDIIQDDDTTNLPSFYNHNASSILENSNKYEAEIISLNIQISSILSMKLYVTNNTNNTIALNKGFSELGVDAQILEYNKSILELRLLQRHSGSSNPAVVHLTRHLNVLKDHIRVTTDNFLTSLYLKKDALLVQKSIMDRQIASIFQQEKKTRNILKEQEIKTTLYSYLLNKRETNILNLAVAESNVEIIEYAKLPNRPVSPVVEKNILFSAVIGFAIPTIVLFITSVFITTIRTKEDIEEYTDIPILGIIPNFKKNKQQKIMGIVIGETSRDIVTEAFRITLSNLSFIRKRLGIESEVIQITSTLPGEGKTTSSMNLALSYAHVNKKIIVIDIDLRRRGLSKLLDNVENIGVSEYLAGKVENIDDIIEHYSEGSNLDYITAGRLPPNAVSLLMSKMFATFISQLRQRYDCIILDSPPYFLTADSQIINTIVDSTIYVIRSKKVNKKILTELDMLYQNNKVNNISFLLTDVNFHVSKSKYGYGDGYGYGYGYGENETD